MLAGVPLAVVGPHQHGTAEKVVLVAFVFVLGLLVVAAAIWVSAALFARPRFVVPPALRRPPKEHTAARR
jgi:hypothetical protein